MKALVDRRIYPDSVISKAVYSLSGSYAITRTLVDDNFEELAAVPVAGASDAEWEARLAQALNDFKLRMLVDEETRAVKTILYAAAFGGDDTFTISDVYD